MEFNGRYAIAAAPERVWAGINDPALLKACIPGCEQLDKTSPTEFVAAVRLKIGPLSAAFKGKVQLADLEPPHRCRLSGEGQGGVAGFAKGEALVVLTPEGAGTVLTYTAKASVGGKLAQIGQRLIDGAAKQIADDFFKRFAAALDTPVLAPDPPVDALPPPASAAPPGATARPGLAPVVWVAGLIAVVAILLLVFGLRA
ncbi:MAG TPA: carbon monoxide dehydrogenase subunit G [Rhizomicrobium sp.]|jgi:carbon monoxide dehydrogenase subunit G|nr:carbon monoxide dehydrogenase subunit G [Rhizomicrobium sp.]